MSKKSKISPLTVAELEKHGKPADKMNSVEKEMLEESRKSLVDKTIHRRNEDWSILASQVVGAENVK